MSSRRRDEPMPVKHWSFAGLMLTYWCNARCASCYLCCRPDCGERMDVEFALRIWGELIRASPHGCRVHLSGGEPFGDWERLIELCRRAASQGLSPLEKIETNAFWATDSSVARERLRALDSAGMGKLVISADPYHQQFVPIERCRLLARRAEDVLGAERVQVRWRDWLADGFDTSDISPGERTALFARCAAGGRDRMNGRAAEQLAPLVPRRPVETLAHLSCRDALLRSRHVHVDPLGLVMPGTCAGIVLGRCGQGSVGDIWRRLDADHADRPIVGTLARAGPVGLLAEAEQLGFRQRPDGYAGKCHLCWELRRFFASRSRHADELGPAHLYRNGLGTPSV